MKIVNETYSMLVVIIPRRMTECLNYGTCCEAELDDLSDHISVHCNIGSCIFRVASESFSIGIAKYDYSCFGNIKVTGQGTEDDPFVVKPKVDKEIEF